MVNRSRDTASSPSPRRESGPGGEVRRKRLIEVAFPLEEVSEHSRREKNVRHGHISTLHIWWARRPLAACRAFIYASLVDDPDNDHDREELLKEVADLASWDAVRKPDLVVRPKEKGGSGLTGRQLLERARQRILDCNDGKPPRLLDPFAGGGAIPLEALRLGCEVEASDLNPVAVLILKCTVEYPQKYGQPNSREVPDYIREAAAAGSQKRFFDGDLVEAYKKNPLATDVRYWGNWMLERAREELAEFYPPEPDGSVPVAYLWSRTVPCPNCGAEMPLIRQYWLARKEKRNVFLSPILLREQNSVDFEVREATSLQSGIVDSTTSQGDSICLLCRQVVKAEQARRLAREGKLGSTLTAVVLESKGREGKGYRADSEADLRVFKEAERELDRVSQEYANGLSAIPDEPIDPSTLGLRVDAFGLDHWSELFNARQLLVLVTLCRLVRDATDLLRKSHDDEGYIRAAATYLAALVDKAADFGSTLCVLNNTGGRGVVHTFGRQTLSFTWDYAEANLFCEQGAGWLSYLTRTVESLGEIPLGLPSEVTQSDARQANGSGFDACITDPPYYNAIDYAGLSDFFYVWLKRSLPEGLYGDLFSLPLTPKREQAIMASESDDPSARQRYVDLTTESFASMAKALSSNGVASIVFAHSDPDAWATLIDALLFTGLIPDASWPIDTEKEGRLGASHRANLQTSVWMSCLPRDIEGQQAFLGDVLAQMRPVIRERLLYFWSKGIRGADFFISAIGPALSVFGRYENVLRPDGTQVTVRDFLDLVRRESTTVALEQVLRGADLGIIDPLTRQYVTWVWSYSRAPLDAGEAIALCLATGADYGQTVRPGSIAVESKEKSKKLVRLRTIQERGAQEDDLGIGTPARPSPLIDQLQRAAWLWRGNKPDEIARYRATLGESRWQALRTLGQAVAECLPDGDDDRRLINGLLSSSAMSAAPRPAQNTQQSLNI
jgi:putative DNA methylase